MKNWIINGRFQVWQRGILFSNPASGAYLADHWLQQYGNASIGTFAISRQDFTPGQTNVPGEPEYFLRFAKSVAASVNTYHSLTHRIEDVRTCAGQGVTLSFYAKANAGRTISATVWQNFGTGGSSTVQVTNATPALTTSWQKFTYSFNVASISGKTVGTGSYLYIDFYMEEASQNPQTTYTIDIAQVQLELGNTATDFDQVLFGDELNRCRRYYWKTFPYDVTPAQNAGNTGAIMTRYPGGSDAVVSHIRFPVQMRRVPTITTYNPDAANNNWREYGANSDRANTVVGNTSQDSVTMRPANGITADVNDAAIHVTADAEF